MSKQLEKTNQLIVKVLKRSSNTHCMDGIRQKINRSFKTRPCDRAMIKSLNYLVENGTIERQMINDSVDGRFIGSTPHYIFKRGNNDGK